MKIPQQKVRVGCYWMHEIHVSADVALFFRLNWYRSGHNKTFLKEIAWPVVSATADFFVSRANRSSSDPSQNW
jgi:trehalose/maltose hydrolase-like predicted phosphorylase